MDKSFKESIAKERSGRQPDGSEPKKPLHLLDVVYILQGWRAGGSGCVEGWAGVGLQSIIGSSLPPGFSFPSCVFL
jgi:hypothetical protein